MSAGAAAIPPIWELEDLDYNGIEKDWNEYELSDGIRMKGRAVVIKITRLPSDVASRFPPPPGASPQAEPYGFATQNIFVVRGRQEDRGPPSPLAPEEVQRPSLVKIPLEILKSDEKWTNYTILKTGKILKLKLMVHSVYRVPNRHDNQGEPAVIINSGIIVTPVKADELPA